VHTVLPSVRPLATEPADHHCGTISDFTASDCVTIVGRLTAYEDVLNRTDTIRDCPGLETRRFTH
jgi:hypothetical protein